MLKRILLALGLLLGLHIVFITGLVIFGLLTGKFDKEKMQQYVATWQGEKLVAYEEEIVVQEAVESPQDASNRIARAQLANEMVTRDLDKDIQNWQNLRLMVELARDKLAQDQQEFLARKEAFEKQVADYNEKVTNEGFTKALKYYSDMRPKLVKDDFMVMDDEEVVRYLAEMKADVATEILNNFKAPNEQAKRVILQRMLNDYKKVEVANN